MPISLNREVAASIDWYGDELAFRCVPGRVTGEFGERLQAATDNVEIATLLAEVVTWIDVIDDQGDPIECTGPVLHATLPMQMIKALWVAVGEQAKTDPQKGSS